MRTLIILSLLAGPLLAQEPAPDRHPAGADPERQERQTWRRSPRREAPDEIRTIHLKSGDTVLARVLDSTGDGLLVEFAGLPGSQGLLSRRVVAPADIYQIERERAGTDAGSWRRLADLAGTLGLRKERIDALEMLIRSDRRHNDRARRELAEAREDLVRSRVNLAREFLEAGDLDRARKHITEALPAANGTLIEEEAVEIHRRVTLDAEEEERNALGVTRERERIQRRYEELGEIAEDLDRAEEDLADAARDRDRSRASTRDLRRALATLEQARRNLNQFEVGMLDPAPLAEVARLRAELRDDLVATHAAFCRVYLQRRNVATARRHLEQASALDPDDPAVQEMDAAVEAGRLAPKPPFDRSPR